MPPKKKGHVNSNTEDKKRELIIKEDNEEYGRIEKNLGDGRFNVNLATGVSMICILAKRFRKKQKKGGNKCEKVFICIGDIILVSFRSFENKCDIIHKYEKSEITKLINLYEIPSSFLSEIGDNSSKDKFQGFEVEEDQESEKIELNQITPQNRNLDMPDFDFDDI